MRTLPAALTASSVDLPVAAPSVDTWAGAGACPAPAWLWAVCPGVVWPVPAWPGAAVSEPESQAASSPKLKTTTAQRRYLVMAALPRTSLYSPRWYGIKLFLFKSIGHKGIRSMRRTRMDLQRCRCQQPRSARAAPGTQSACPLSARRAPAACADGIQRGKRGRLREAARGCGAGRPSAYAGQSVARVGETAVADGAHDAGPLVEALVVLRRQ